MDKRVVIDQKLSRCVLTAMIKYGTTIPDIDLGNSYFKLHGWFEYDDTSEQLKEVSTEVSLALNKVYGRSHMDCLFDRMKSTHERYINAENKLQEIIDMPWYKRIFCGNKITEFLANQEDKYGAK